MTKETNITKISEPLGHSPGYVRVHLETREAGEEPESSTHNLALDWEHYNEDGTPNTSAIEETAAREFCK